jgi:hypothetical protein
MLIGLLNCGLAYQPKYTEVSLIDKGEKRAPDFRFLLPSIGIPMTANVPDDKSSTFALTDLINDR